MRIDEAALGVLLIICIGLILLAVFYYLNIQNTLKEVSQHNQQMPPANVWLMFIPFFNYVFGFIMYAKVAESLRLEFEEREDPRPGDYGKGLGTAQAALSIAGFVLNLIGLPTAISGLISVTGITLMIIYWVKMAEYKNQLMAGVPATSASKPMRDNDLLD